MTTKKRQQINNAITAEDIENLFPEGQWNHNMTVYKCLSPLDQDGSYNLLTINFVDGRWLFYDFINYAHGDIIDLVVYLGLTFTYKKAIDYISDKCNYKFFFEQDIIDFEREFSLSEYVF